MKNVKKLWLVATMFVMVALSLSLMGRSEARPIISFDLTNKTGLNMHKLYIAPAVEGVPWSTNMLSDGPLADDETVKVGFQPGTDDALYDVKMVDQDGKEYIWGKLELLEASGVVISLEKGKAIASVVIPK